MTMYEAVILDIGNEQIISRTDANPLKAVMSAIQDAHEDVYEEVDMSPEELRDGYKFAKTTDEDMKDMFTFPQAVDLMEAGTVSLFVIVSWDRMTAPIGFFRKL
jgi:hypothetical protein